MPGIIVGVDGSGHSQRALVQAIKEAAVHHAPLTVITVHQAIMGFGGSPVFYPEDPVETERAPRGSPGGNRQSAGRAGEPRPESVTVKAVHGFPPEVLIEASRDADMVVLGSRGTGGFGVLAMGSVTSQVAHHASCPVLIVPPERRG